MPKSGKERILDFLIENAAFEIMWADVDSDEEAVDEILDDLNGNLLLLVACRRGIPSTAKALTVSRNDIISSMSDDCFQQMLRVNKQQFAKIVKLIENDAEFICGHSCQQVPIELQVAITLYRLGVSGEDATIKNVAKKFAVGKGGTVSIITNRVFQALLKHKAEFIFWPDENERRQITIERDSKMPFCIGYVNSTEIKLVDPPTIQQKNYFSINQVYSIKAQIVSDHNLKIRHVSKCYVGSYSNARIYRNCSFVENEAQYFTSRQWLAGDASYPLTERLITPYRKKSKEALSSEQEFFNIQHNQYRSKVDHCLYALKQRFASLKELRLRIFSAENHDACSDWFLVCCMLHNMFLSDEDYSDFQNNLPIKDENNEENIEDESIASYNAAEMMRDALCALMRT